MAVGYVLAAVAVAGLYLWLRHGDNENRIEALKRLALGVPFFVAMFFAGAVFGGIVDAVWFVDVSWQFLTGGDGFDTDGYADRFWGWKDRNTRYMLTGDGSPVLLP
jgi:hypothetical protein